MALRGLAQFCFVVVAFLVTAHVHASILLGSALAEGLSPPVDSPENAIVSPELGCSDLRDQVVVLHQSAPC